MPFSAVYTVDVNLGAESSVFLSSFLSLLPYSCHISPLLPSPPCLPLSTSPHTTGCTLSNGGCGQLCMTSSDLTGYSCQCGRGYQLSSNGVSCIPNDGQSSVPPAHPKHHTFNQCTTCTLLPPPQSLRYSFRPQGVCLRR